jgi:hypothetical protein
MKDKVWVREKCNFISALRQQLLVLACLVVGGKGILFLEEEGTGKTPAKKIPKSPDFELKEAQKLNLINSALRRTGQVRYRYAR